MISFRKIWPCNLTLYWGWSYNGIVLISRLVMALWKGVYHWKNSRFIKIFSICSKPIWFTWLIHQLWLCTVPLKVSFWPTGLSSWLTGLTVGKYTCNNVQLGARQQIHWQSHLQIICTYTQSSYSGHSNLWGKTLKSSPWKSGGSGFWLVKPWFIMNFFIL